MFNLFKKKEIPQSQAEAIKEKAAKSIKEKAECNHIFMELWKVVETPTGYVANMFCKNCGKIKEISLWN